MNIKKYVAYLVAAGSRISAIAAQFALLGFIGNYIGLEASGYYATIFSFASIASIVLVYGQGAFILRNVPSAHAAGDYVGSDSAILHGIVTVSLIGGLLLGIIIPLGYWSTGTVTGSLYAASMGMSIAFLSLYGAVLRSLGSVWLSESAKGLFWRALSLVFLASIYFSGIKLEPDQLVAVIVGSTLLCTVILYIHLYIVRNFDFSKIRIKEILKTNSVNTKNWMLQILQACLQNIDVVFVGGLLGYAEAGVYFVFSRLASLVSLPLSVTNPVILPTIGRYANGERSATISGRIRRNALLNTSFSVLAFALILTFSSNLLAILGVREIDTPERIAFILLMVSHFINVIVGPTAFSSQLFDVKKEALIILVIHVLLVLVGLFFFAETFGIVGIAAIVSIGRIGTNIFTLEVIRRKVGLNLLTGR